MRRKDREVKDVAQILAIIDKCEVCRLAFSQNEIPYIVPMNFGYKYENETLTLYFHCAGEGKKLDIMQSNPNVSFEMDCSHRIITGVEACDYTMEYESVIGFGWAECITSLDGKERALSFIMSKYAKGKSFTYTPEMLNCVTIFQVVVTGFTGKRHITP